MIGNKDKSMGAIRLQERAAMPVISMREFVDLADLAAWHDERKKDPQSISPEWHRDMAATIRGVLLRREIAE
ncbi:hypothetical protein C3R74_11620 [Acidithiobacillus ferridurans]|uniref:hypothetical protein n=1 Tax=Acidithiobacillus ferridurans TaxID=1232575 RepID=UPI000DE5640B|nr:hypothetical protein [Acidithiobacillus ferridurans]RBL99160.1 hypothetical protein C3R74_11620 [Acidithiobacillus ferridurans]